VVTVPDATYHSAITALLPRPAPASSAGHTNRSSSVRPVLAHRDKSSDGASGPAISSVLGGSLTAPIHGAIEGPVTVALSPDVTLARARRSHQSAFAEQVVPELMSWRMDEADAVIDPVEGLDLTSLRLR
jgi:hypothetical protein